MISSKQVMRSAKTKVRKNREYDDEQSMKQHKRKKQDKALLRSLRQEKDGISF
jgi:hypothetical protein